MPRESYHWACSCRVCSLACLTYRPGIFSAPDHAWAMLVTSGGAGSMRTRLGGFSPWSGLVRLGLVWFGLVWFGLVRTGPVWHGSRREASRRRVSEGILNVYQFGLLFLFIPSSHSLLVQSSGLLTLSDYLVAVACQPEILSGRVPRSITGKIDLLIQLVDNVSRYHLISEAILEFACIPARSSMIHDNVRFSGEGVC
jgi:hypothetical protein